MGVCWARRSLTELTPHFKTMDGWRLLKKPTKLNIFPKLVSCADYDPQCLLLLSVSAQDEQRPRDHIVGSFGLTLTRANYFIFAVCLFEYLLPPVRSWTVIQVQPWGAQDYESSIHKSPSSKPSFSQCAEHSVVLGKLI